MIERGEMILFLSQGGRLIRSKRKFGKQATIRGGAARRNFVQIKSKKKKKTAEKGSGGEKETKKTRHTGTRRKGVELEGEWERREAS